MPLDAEGQILLNPPTMMPPKRAMLVRLTEETLEALSAQLSSTDPKQQFPQVEFSLAGKLVSTWCLVAGLSLHNVRCTAN